MPFNTSTLPAREKAESKSEKNKSNKHTWWRQKHKHTPRRAFPSSWALRPTPLSCFSPQMSSDAPSARSSDTWTEDRRNGFLCAVHASRYTFTHCKLRLACQVTAKSVQRQDLCGGKVKGLLKHHLFDHRAGACAAFPSKWSMLQMLIWFQWLQKFRNLPLKSPSLM